MAEMMIGGSLKDIRKGEGRVLGAERFTAKNLNLAGSGDFDVSLKAVSFTVRAGEILGIAGVAGNGQTELLPALSGETPVAEGRRHHARRQADRQARDQGAAAARPVRRCPRNATAMPRCPISRSPTTPS